jgi:hypothetical protein
MRPCKEENMKSEEIKVLFDQFEAVSSEYEGV